jgi:hypothetical protein
MVNKQKLHFKLFKEFYMKHFVDSGFELKGDVWMKVGNNLTREQILENPDRKFENLIVDVCSDLIAEWAFTGTITLTSEHVPGILTLAVGTGALGWDLQNPPTETSNLTVLYSELMRKTFTSKNYVDSLGSPSASRTNIIDFLTTFLETEAVGPIVEMGLFGGANSLNSNGGTRINARHFPVLNKPAGSQLSILWRLTF